MGIRTGRRAGGTTDSGPLMQAVKKSGGSSVIEVADSDGAVKNLHRFSEIAVTGIFFCGRTRMDCILREKSECFRNIL